MVGAEVQKALEHRQRRKRRPLGAYHQHHGRLGPPGHLVGAGPGGGKPQAVVVPHDPLDDADRPAGGMPGQQEAQGIFRKEEGVQIGAGRADDAAVKHGVDVVRPAFEAARIDPPVHQRLKHRAGQGGLSAAAVGARQQQARQVLLHPPVPLRFV